MPGVLNTVPAAPPPVTVRGTGELAIDLRINIRIATQWYWCTSISKTNILLPSSDLYESLNTLVTEFERKQKATAAFIVFAMFTALLTTVGFVLLLKDSDSGRRMVRLCSLATILSR